MCASRVLLTEGITIKSGRPKNERKNEPIRDHSYFDLTLVLHLVSSFLLKIANFPSWTLPPLFPLLVNRRCRKATKFMALFSNCGKTVAYIKAQKICLLFFAFFFD